MGLETTCHAQFGRQSGEGKAHLDSKELTFKGDFRVTVPLVQVQSAKAIKGQLTLTTPEGKLALDLGDPASEKWLAKILNPPSLIDKLGVKDGQKVAAMGDANPILEKELARRKVTRGKSELDWIFLTFSSPAALAGLAALEPKLARDGGLWIIYPKGKTSPIRETEVMAASKDAGFVIPKTCSFSDTLTAMKLVIPVARR
jgi:hypothetical protein